jgi:hypothetical protein
MEAMENKVQKWKVKRAKEAAKKEKALKKMQEKNQKENAKKGKSKDIMKSKKSSIGDTKIEVGESTEKAALLARLKEIEAEERENVSVKMAVENFLKTEEPEKKDEVDAWLTRSKVEANIKKCSGENPRTKKPCGFTTEKYYCNGFPIETSSIIDLDFCIHHLAQKKDNALVKSWINKQSTELKGKIINFMKEKNSTT